MGKIIVRDLNSYAYHGCLNAEKEIGGHYKTTICVEGDFSKSEDSDLLQDAIDYEMLGLIAQEQMQVSSNLIENVVGRIFNEIETKLSSYDIQHIYVKVVKVNPPVKGDVPQVEYIKEKQFN